MARAATNTCFRAPTPVIGITVDPPFVLAAWKAAHGVDYTFLSDYNREVVRAYGVAFPALGGLPGYVAAKSAFHDRVVPG